ncbi:unnamed protein product [Prunus armeniaca]|uniref:Uncharacterized protein n=1 Tax=Prunus armeniaca TaxID=36596 RepID=A0A6J5WEZ2_PRUAR|nr:unnamed protein product [Prunus armeniaca]
MGNLVNWEVIHELLLSFAEAGANVLRLKGGIVHVTLDNYEPDTHIEDDERGEPHHNWVDEVVRSEGRVGVVGAD